MYYIATVPYKKLIFRTVPLSVVTYSYRYHDCKSYFLRTAYIYIVMLHMCM